MNDQAHFDFYELKMADRLPSPTGTALAIMQLLEQEEATVEAIAHLVKGDPALTSRLLRMANSPALGLRRPLIAVEEAIRLLGFKVVRQFALGLSLVNQYRSGQCAAFDYRGYWAYSLAQAVAIQTLTSRERTIAPEEAFTLGLLSEMGRLALATAWPDDYAKVLQQTGSAVTVCSPELLALERQSFAIDHRGLTLRLLSDWGIPAPLLNALDMSWRTPLAEGQERQARLARQLSLARLLAEQLMREARCETAVSELPEWMTHQGYDGESWACLLREIGVQWQEWNKLLGIDTTSVVQTSPPSGPGDQDPRTSAQDPALHILLVDDDPMLLARLAKPLGSLGYRVTTCRDGQTALKLALELHPDLVITDWHMKPLDGLKLTQVLRASALGKGLYIIMLTATEDEDALVQAFDVGIDDYVIKPPSLKVLVARIRAGQRIIGLQRALHQERLEIERYSAELAVANRRLEAMANTDMLTGLPNRRYCMSRLEQEWLAAQRFNRPLSVLILDLDHFKSINDALGHDVGDEVLKHAARLMRESVRGNDTVCRMGGEEFLVIAANTEGAAAAQLGERIRAAIEREQPEGVRLARPLTVSIGIAWTIGARLSPTELIKLADQALYYVKQTTRNAVRVACCV